MVDKVEKMWEKRRDNEAWIREWRGGSRGGTRWRE
jgi:hypothetical protein